MIVRVAALAAGLALAVSACGGSEESEPTNPLTGLPGEVTGPVQAVKIDNTPKSWPQSGLNDADVVYLEQVEGGQTRLMAIYAANRPSEVYPVRSARENDIELLNQYGPVILTYSGANTGVQQSVDASPLTAVTEDANPQYFGVAAGREKLYGTTANVAAIAEDFPDAGGVRDVGFAWGEDEDISDESDPEADSGGTSGASVWDGATPSDTWQVSMGQIAAGFSWSEADSAWVFRMRGDPVGDARGGEVLAKNVIVQYSEIAESQYVDTTGARTPYTKSVGSGDAVVFRDGRSLTGRWNRSSEASGTTYETADGQEIPLAPGGVWVLLAPKGNPIRGS